MRFLYSVLEIVSQLWTKKLFSPKLQDKKSGTESLGWREIGIYTLLIEAIPRARFTAKQSNYVITCTDSQYKPFAITSSEVPAVVDLPTPPFPEATTNTWLTPAMGHFLGRPLRMASSEDAELKRRNNQPRIFARTMLVRSLANQIHLCLHPKSHTLPAFLSRDDCMIA